MSLSGDAVLYYATRPVYFVEDIIRATPDDKQGAILESVAANTMTTVRSGHGIGKTTVQAWLVHWFLSTRPFPKIPCTAPTQHQLYDILWAEINKWRRNSPALSEEIVWTKEKVSMKGYPEEWFAVARTASTPDALQGFHADHVLYIIDEASGVKDEIFEPVLGSLSTEGARLLMCGNPTKKTGFFYLSHTRNRDSYKAFHVDGRKSPRVSKDFVNRIISMYGEDSDVFRVRVAGEFPLNEDDVFIQLPLVEQTIMNELEPAQVQRISIGVDVARYGDDETVIATNIGGDIKLPIVRHGQSLMQTVGDVVLTYKRLLAENPTYKGVITAVIDDTGLGGGVTDRLEEVKAEQRLHRLEIVPVNFGTKPPQDGTGEHYDDLTTYMWATMRDLMKQGLVKFPDDDDLVGQFTVRKYGITSNGRIKLESKKDMKKRGIRSPDRADAVTLSCYTPNKVYNGFVEKSETIIVPYEAVQSMQFTRVNIGISIGSTVKGTSFVATAITARHARAVALAAVQITGEVETDALGKAFADFAMDIKTRYGRTDYAYCDAKEAFLLRCIRDAATRYSLGVNVRVAAKDETNNAIRLTTRLIAQDRLLLTKDCAALERALESATWSDARADDKRSETSDNGMLRAFEYTIEREAARFIDGEKAAKEG